MLQQKEGEEISTESAEKLRLFQELYLTILNVELAVHEMSGCGLSHIDNPSFNHVLQSAVTTSKFHLYLFFLGWVGGRGGSQLTLHHCLSSDSLLVTACSCSFLFFLPCFHCFWAEPKEELAGGGGVGGAIWKKKGRRRGRASTALPTCVEQKDVTARKKGALAVCSLAPPLPR